MANKNNTVVDYYDNIADDYDNSRFGGSYGQFIDYQERRLLNKLIKPIPGGKRLEIACGTGRLTGYATHALDASAAMMKHAQQRHPQVMFRQASAAETGFDDNMFHTIYCFHLMMHLEPSLIQDIITEAHRILKPGGRFIFDIPSQKRRRLIHHKHQTWHGGTDLSKDDVLKMTSHLFDLGRTHGIMMMPVHKLPARLRSPLRACDYALAGCCLLKQYSSYIAYELIKK